jgi:Collagen triple helix repeat (20 copies)
MKSSIIFLTLFSGLILTACDRPAPANTPSTVIVPVPTVPGPAGATGAAGDPGVAGKQGATGESGDVGVKGETGKTGVEGVQGEPGKTGGDTTVIVTPPEATPPAN